MANGVLVMSVHFTQSCPTCGRRIRIRASLMGCEVGCQHCHAVFVAQADGVSGAKETVPNDESRDPLMDRVEQVLHRADESVAVG